MPRYDSEHHSLITTFADGREFHQPVSEYKERAEELLSRDHCHLFELELIGTFFLDLAEALS